MAAFPATLLGGPDGGIPRAAVLAGAGATVAGFSCLAWWVCSEKEGEESRKLREALSEDTQRSIESALALDRDGQLPRAESFLATLMQSEHAGGELNDEQAHLLRRCVERELREVCDRTERHRRGEPGNAGFSDGVRLAQALVVAECADITLARRQRTCFSRLRPLLMWRPWGQARWSITCLDAALISRGAELYAQIKAERRMAGASGTTRVFRLWSSVLPGYVVGVAAGVAQSSLSPWMFAALTEVVDTAKRARESSGPSSTEENGRKQIKNAAMVAAGVFLGSRFLAIVAQVFTERAESYFQLHLRDMVLRAVVCQDMAFFDRQSYQRLHDRLQSAVSTTAEQLFQTPAQWVASLVFVVSSARTVIRDAPQLVLPCVIPIPVGLVLLAVMFTCMDEPSDSGSAWEGLTLREIQTVRAHAQEREEVVRMHAIRTEERRRNGKAQLKTVMMWKAGESLLASGALGMYYVGANMVLVGKLEAGKLQGLQILATSLLPSVAQLLYCSWEATQILRTVRKAAELIDARPSIEPLDETVQRASPAAKAPPAVPRPLERSEVQGRIEFVAVRFSYPNSSGSDACSPVLKSLSFAVEPGQKVALVGRRGCGKSTVCRLLQRFYDPDGGQILLDGHPLASYDVHQLRRAVCVVSQDPVLLGETLRDAICYGMQPKPPEEEIEAACRDANAWEFIAGGGDFQDQLNTRLVGPGAVKLSGGQRQCVSIARALVRRPPILLLDEATSNLDTVSEGRVQGGLDNLRRKDWIRSSITIAHRLHTVIGAHKIVVISDGVAAEQGTHSELCQIPVELECASAQSGLSAAASGIGAGASATQSFSHVTRGIYHHMWNIQSSHGAGTAEDAAGQLWELEDQLAQLRAENSRLQGQLRDARAQAQSAQRSGLGALLSR